MSTNTALQPKARTSREDQAHLDALCVNTIRTLAMDAVQKADSGHPGTPMALAPLAYVLWTKFLRYNPENPGGSTVTGSSYPPAMPPCCNTPCSF